MVNDIVFKGISSFNYPYKHIFVQELFSKGYAEKLLAWLESTNQFVPVEDTFYKQSMLPINHETLPKELSTILSNENKMKIKSIVEKAFDTTFHSNYVITAHKILKGEGIDIHNDYQDNPYQYKYGFTHRLIVYLNRGWNEKDGGKLNIYKSHKYEDLVRSFNPIHNTAVGLEFSLNSYHSVSNVNDGERYTINFSFLKVKDI